MRFWFSSCIWYLATEVWHLSPSLDCGYGILVIDPCCMSRVCDFMSNMYSAVYLRFWASLDLALCPGFCVQSECSYRFGFWCVESGFRNPLSVSGIQLLALALHSVLESGESL